MNRLAMASVLALALAPSSFPALAADGAGGDGSTDVERSLSSVRIASTLDDTCFVWIDGKLRATIGPFGNTGIIAVAPPIASQPTDILVRCNTLGTYHTIMAERHKHCDLSLDPQAGHTIVVDHCK